MANKSFIERCDKSGINVNAISPIRKRLVLLHKYLETDFISIVAFANSYSDLWNIMCSQPRYGSNKHKFIITANSNGCFDDTFSSLPLLNGLSLISIKDKSLINICKNVGELLSVGEFAMLKKSYFKSLAWFEKAKNTASLGADIIDNY